MNVARRQLLTQADVSRACKGALAAGLRIGRIEIDTVRRTVIVFPAGEGAEPVVTAIEPAAPAAEPNDFDE